MADGIMIASECADWWQQEIKNRKEDLESFVMEHPDWFGITVATAGGTALDVFDMFIVDLLRLGEGAAQGTVKGFVQDILRVMSVLPQGKVMKGVQTVPKGLLGRMVQSFQLGKLWRTVQGELCVPIAIAQAMQRTGQKLAVGLKEVADALGQPLLNLYRQGQNFWPDIGPALQRLGVQFNTLPAGSLATFAEVVKRAASSDGPLLVRVIAKDASGQILGGHAILIGKTASGVKIIDRYGFVRDLNELARNYHLHEFVFDTRNPIYAIKNAVIDESLITLVKEFGALASLARVSIGIFDFNHQKVNADSVKEQFEKFSSERGSKEKVLLGEAVTIVGGKTVTVKAGHPKLSTLSGIAKAEYGSFDLWPLIYDLNKDKIGPNPNHLKPNTPLLVLPLDRYDPKEVADAKKRAPSWKSYS